MRYCSSCGREVTLQVPPGDSLPRHVCVSCGAIHYQNPKLVVGAIPVHEGKILLARRAIEPRLGLWTLPAGFMENNETTAEAAIRETREEVCAEIELEMLFSMIDIPHISQVHLFYLARMRTPAFAAGIESQEVRFFGLDELPWDEIAFRSTTVTLQHYISDRLEGRYTFHLADLRPLDAH